MEFLYRSDRPEILPVCRVMETWFDSFPDLEKDQLHRRLSSRNDAVFHSAFFELYLFTLLRKRGFVVELPRSETQGQKTEDFRAFLNERLAFRLEAKFVGKEEHHAWQDSFQEEIERSLDEAHVEGVWFEVDLDGTFVGQPSPRRVRDSFESWFKKEKNGILKGMEEKIPPSSLPRFQISETGVKITISPLFTKPESTSDCGPVVLWASGGRWMQTDEKLRKALRRKASRYGEMEVPFIVALSMWENADERDIWNALFGDEVFSIGVGPKGPVGKPVPSRKPNGFWLGPHGPQNRRVSAILLVDELFPWSVASKQPIIYHNPWAEHPLSAEALPLAQMVPNHEERRFVRKPSEPIHTVLGLSPRWPWEH